VRLVLVSFTSRAGEGADLVEALSSMLPDTAASRGCLGVELFRDPEDADQVTMIERWEDAESYEAYLAWRAEGGPTLVGSLLEGGPQRSYHDSLASFAPPGATAP
jgi:hypothetical protein